MRLIRHLHSDETDREGRPDLTPLIDLIFLLLIFLLLTTRFVPEEQALSQILNDAGVGPPLPTILEAERLRLRWEVSKAADGEVILRCDDQELRLPAPATADMTAELNRVHAFLALQLQRYELAGEAASAQVPVEISSPPHLAWRWALWSYDAVQAYENRLRPPLAARSPQDAGAGRTVQFLPPPPRRGDF